MASLILYAVGSSSPYKEVKGMSVEKFIHSVIYPIIIQRDGEDMVEVVRNCQNRFKEYYIQMQAAKRSQAPHPSQLKDDRIILDKTLADQVSSWKSSRGLSDKMVTDYACSGETCSYYQIGDVFICEKTGHVHGAATRWCDR